MTMNNAPEIAPLADMFRLLGDATRLRILILCAEGEIAVGDIAKRLNLSQSLVSHHLRLLRAARLARGERRGRNVFYIAADAHVRRMISDMRAHAREPEIAARTKLRKAS